MSYSTVSIIRRPDDAPVEARLLDEMPPPNCSLWSASGDPSDRSSCRSFCRRVFRVLTGLRAYTGIGARRHHNSTFSNQVGSESSANSDGKA